MVLKKLAIQTASKLTGYIDSVWYLPLIGLASTCGVFVGFVSMDFVLIVSTLLQPAYWLRVAIVLSLGSAIGSFLLGQIIQIYASQVFDKLWNFAPHGDGWIWANQLLAHHGILALALLILSPLPLTPLVVYSASIGVSPLEILFAVFVGRAVKYAIIGRLVFYVPDFFYKRLIKHYKAQ